MKVQEFNEKYLDKGFQIVEIKSYMRTNSQHVRRFVLEQYCPLVEKWCRMLITGPWNISVVSDNEIPISDDKIDVPNKTIKRWMSICQEDRIIIVQAEHGCRYFSAQDNEQIGRVAITLLKERVESDCFLYETRPKPPRDKWENFSYDLEMSMFVKKRWDIYKRDLQQHKKNVEQAQSASKALETNDYLIATSLLLCRNDLHYEYERFEIKTLETV